MKKYLKLSITCLFLEALLILFNVFSLSAQKIERFSNKEGLNQNTILTIEHDKYGFLWFGTPNGLIKYDGYEFKSYTNESDINNSISNNYINYLYNDSSGILWIGTNTGLNTYIPWLEKFRTIPIPSNFRISHIASGPHGRIWVSTKNELYICNPIDIENGVYEVSSNILSDFPDTTYINDFYFLNENTFLLATSNGLSRFSIENESNIKTIKAKTPTVFKSFSNRGITAIKKIKDIFWVGTNAGLFKTTLEGNRMHIISEINKINNTFLTPNIVVNTILEDHNGTVWIGTKENGLAKYVSSTDSFENFNYNPKNKLGLSSPYIYSIFEDDFNVLWIGTAQGGINKLDVLQKQFINYTNNPYDNTSISDNLITSILEDSRGTLWVSSYNESIFRSTEKINNDNIQNLRFEKLGKEFPLSKQDIVRCIYEDRKGYIWIGSEFSLVIYNPLTNTFKKIALKENGKIAPDQTYFTINQTDDDQIIIGGTQIIVLQNPWQYIEKEKEPVIEVSSYFELGSKLAYTILKDSRDNYWFGTFNGLYKGTINNGKINFTDEYKSNNNEKLKLSNSDIFSLYEDGEKNVWVGTFGGGLNKMVFDDVGKLIKIDYFRKKSILPDDAVYGILPEGKDFLWMSTDMGLCKFDTKENTLDVFDVRDGLINNNFRQGAYHKGKSGFYYFGGLNGLTLFNPSTIKTNKLVPKVLITALQLNNKTVEIGKEYKGDVLLKNSISETESISINQNEQIITFNLAVQHSTSPYKNKIAYQLEGFNESWIEKNTGKTNATYTNLSPGSYTLKVKGANGDGVWNNETTNLKLEILPPWYFTWWSILIFSILIISATLGIIIYFVEHEKLKQRLKYEELNKKQLDETNQGKFRFFTNISHEFRTPLTLISGPLERVIEQNNDIKNTKYLEIIQKNTKRLLSLADQLITFRQAEQGYTNLKLTKNTLGNFMYPATEAFENYATEKNINFFYKVNSPNEEIVLDVEKVERIIYNLLSNSFKNTPPNGNISVESDIIKQSNKKIIKIDVIDNGKGIPEENLKDIFERFYQLGDNDEKISGGGIGLAFCKSITDLLGGTISVKSTPFSETRFSILIPSKNDDEILLDNVSQSGESFIKNWVSIPINSKTINAENISKNSFQKKHTILIVENEEDVQNFLTISLSEHYNIIIANNGVEGLEKIKSSKPHLVISDVMMPEMNGFELCNEIKKDVEICHIPVLLLTALGDSENLIKGLEFGADEYISKPFSLKHLELRIDKLIKNNIKLKEYFSKNSLLPKKDIDISTRDIEFLNKVISAIEKNISDSNFGVEELANEVNLSTSHLYRRLKQLTGQVPNVYLRNFRLQRAAELLRENNGLKVAEVMYQIGIESTSYFSTSFKKLHGVPPSEF
ncbi:two-component regulator propeller domain-containing protein [Flavivirga aquimarina]|uniref:histidine kinase n=1 Tax=Flavivirga aquimarina TaxID=2027862 RepID=A0ABT8W8X7_9FLAO|nr:two-component regulator propeller domain-containing protein [Flavivirga aquimarina]MDO5969584.1 two-component regulator propeller domain-containing protein [Flavivirga aquimarina]